MASEFHSFFIFPWLSITQEQLPPDATADLCGSFVMRLTCAMDMFGGTLVSLSQRTYSALWLSDTVNIQIPSNWVPTSEAIMGPATDLYYKMVEVRVIPDNVLVFFLNKDEVLLGIRGSDEDDALETQLPDHHDDSVSDSDLTRPYDSGAEEP